MSELSFMLANEYHKGMPGDKKDTSNYSQPPIGWFMSEKYDGYRAGYNPQDVINQRTTTRITPAVTSTLTGLDQLRTAFQEEDALQRIADAGGVANLAGGGIAGLSGGKKSGPPPISGPTPDGDEGLPAAFKRVKKG